MVDRNHNTNTHARSQACRRAACPPYRLGSLLVPEGGSEDTCSAPACQCQMLQAFLLLLLAVLLPFRTALIENLQQRWVGV